MEFDASTSTLVMADVAIALRKQVAGTLVVLMNKAPALVSIDDLLDAVWGRNALSPSAVPQAIRELRRALGDDAQAPTYIETRHKLGYRWLPEVCIVEARAPSAQPEVQALDAPINEVSNQLISRSIDEFLAEHDEMHSAAFAVKKRPLNIVKSHPKVMIASAMLLSILGLGTLIQPTPVVPDHLIAAQTPATSTSRSEPNTTVPNDTVTNTVSRIGFPEVREAYFHWRYQTTRDLLQQRSWPVRQRRQAAFMLARIEINAGNLQAAESAIAQARASIDADDLVNTQIVESLEAQLHSRDVSLSVSAHYTLQEMFGLHPEGLSTTQKMALADTLLKDPKVSEESRYFITVLQAGASNNLAQASHAMTRLDQSKTLFPELVALANAEYAKLLHQSGQTGDALKLSLANAQSLLEHGLKRDALRARFDAFDMQIAMDDLQAASSTLATNRELMRSIYYPKAQALLRASEALLATKTDQAQQAVAQVN
jgi:DNA-binding winged helix-turn-helix (wHTH) protein